MSAIACETTWHIWFATAQFICGTTWHFASVRMLETDSDGAIGGGDFRAVGAIPHRAMPPIRQIASALVK